MSNDHEIDVAKSKKDLEIIFKNIIQFINENKYDEKIQVRMDSDNEILKIYSNNSSVLRRANAAISEILDYVIFFCRASSISGCFYIMHLKS